MWKKLNRLYDCMNTINYSYIMQQTMFHVPFLLKYIEEVYETVMTDDPHWQYVKGSICEMKALEEDICKAEEVKDFVSVYDIINSKLWKEVEKALEILLLENIDELKEYFWHSNIEFLKVRYPMISQYIGDVRPEDDMDSCRSYGIRGRVICRVERDLYSGYNPIEMGIKMAESMNLNRYCKIYMWGYNGGFELNGIEVIGRTDVEVYITDLAELKQILLNTTRGGVIEPSHIQYKFDISVKEFMKKIDLGNKEEMFIYICEPENNSVAELKQFIVDNSIHSNIRAAL